jgi:hypothetical protein
MIRRSREERELITYSIIRGRSERKKKEGIIPRAASDPRL